MKNKILRMGSFVALLIETFFLLNGSTNEIKKDTGPLAPYFCLCDNLAVPYEGPLLQCDGNEGTPKGKQTAKRSKNRVLLLKNELQKLSSCILAVKNAFQEGVLPDPLCSDTSCQIRVPILLSMFERYVKGKINFDNIPAEDRIFLARAYLLHRSKGLIKTSFLENKNNQEEPFYETIDEETFSSLSGKKTGVYDCKRLVSQNALNFLRQKVKTVLSNTSIPTFALKTGVGILTTPCFISVLALFRFCKQTNTPIVIRCSTKDFSQPFGVPQEKDFLKEEAAAILCKIDEQKHPIFVFQEESAKPLSAEQPICVIDGYSQNVDTIKSFFIKNDFEKLEEILLANAATHYQVGGEYKKQELIELLLKEKNECTNELKDRYLDSQNKALELMKTFTISHIMPSIYKRINQYEPSIFIKK